jgi:hypothetical protein
LLLRQAFRRAGFCGAERRLELSCGAREITRLVGGGARVELQDRLRRIASRRGRIIVLRLGKIAALIGRGGGSRRRVR